MIRRDAGSVSTGTAVAAPHLAAERAAGMRAARGVKEERAGGSTSALRKAAILLVSLDQALASAILAHLSKEQVEAVTLEIARLEQVTPEEQARVWEEFYQIGWRRLHFGFDDVVRLSVLAVGEVFAAVGLERWVLALAGAPREVRDEILRKLPAECGEVLEGRLEGLGPFRLADAESAQAEVVERVLELADAGVITLPAPGRKEDVLV